MNLSIDERKDESADIWGTATTTNAGGSWSGPWTGTVEVGYTTHRLSGVYTGSGEYAGLAYTWTKIGEEVYISKGTIAPTK